LIERVHDRLGIVPTHLAADKAYGSAPLLAWLIARGVAPHIPVIDRARRTDGLITREAFRFDPASDRFTCPQGSALTFKMLVRSTQVRIYRSRPTDCAACPIKPRCTNGQRRTVTRLAAEDARDHVRALRATEAYSRSRRLRKRIERVFGHLKRNFRLDRLKLRGLKGAREEFLMAASAYNLQLLARQAAPA
jgi:hypothetical protein